MCLDIRLYSKADLQVSSWWSNTRASVNFNFPSLVLLAALEFMPKYISETPVHSHSSQVSVCKNIALLFPASHFPDLYYK